MYHHFFYEEPDENCSMSQQESLNVVITYGESNRTMAEVLQNNQLDLDIPYSTIDPIQPSAQSHVKFDRLKFVNQQNYDQSAEKQQSNYLNESSIAISNYSAFHSAQFPDGAKSDDSVCKVIFEKRSACGSYKVECDGLQHQNCITNDPPKSFNEELVAVTLSKCETLQTENSQITAVNQSVHNKIVAKDKSVILEANTSNSEIQTGIAQVTSTRDSEMGTLSTQSHDLPETFVVLQNKSIVSCEIESAAIFQDSPIINLGKTQFEVTHASSKSFHDVIIEQASHMVDHNTVTEVSRIVNDEMNEKSKIVVDQLESTDISSRKTITTDISTYSNNTSISVTKSESISSLTVQEKITAVNAENFGTAREVSSRMNVVIQSESTANQQGMVILAQILQNGPIAKKNYSQCDSVMSMSFCARSEIQPEPELQNESTAEVHNNIRENYSIQSYLTQKNTNRSKANNVSAENSAKKIDESKFRNSKTKINDLNNDSIEKFFDVDEIVSELEICSATSEINSVSLNTESNDVSNDGIAIFFDVDETVSEFNYQSSKLLNVEIVQTAEESEKNSANQIQDKQAGKNSMTIKKKAFKVPVPRKPQVPAPTTEVLQLFDQLVTESNSPGLQISQSTMMASKPRSKFRPPALIEKFLAVASQTVSLTPMELSPKSKPIITESLSIKTTKKEKPTFKPVQKSKKRSAYSSIALVLPKEKSAIVHESLLGRTIAPPAVFAGDQDFAEAKFAFEREIEAVNYGIGRVLKAKNLMKQCNDGNSDNEMESEMEKLEKLHCKWQEACRKGLVELKSLIDPRVQDFNGSDSAGSFSFGKKRGWDSYDAYGSCEISENEHDDDDKEDEDSEEGETKGWRNFVKSILSAETDVGFEKDKKKQKHAEEESQDAFAECEQQENEEHEQKLETASSAVGSEWNLRELGGKLGIDVDELGAQALRLSGDLRGAAQCLEAVFLVDSRPNNSQSIEKNTGKNDAKSVVNLTPLFALQTRIQLALVLADALEIHSRTQLSLGGERHSLNSLVVAADSHIQKASLLAAKLPSHPDLKCLLAHAHVRLLLAADANKNLSAAKRVLKFVAEEAAVSPSCIHWHFFFLSKLAHLLILEHDFVAALSLLTVNIADADKHMSSAQDDKSRVLFVQVKGSFLFQKLHIYLRIRDTKSAASLILTALDPLFSETVNIPKLTELNHTYWLLKILHASQIANRKSSKVNLEILLDIVEKSANTEVNFGETVNNTDAGLDETCPPSIAVNILSRSQRDALTYLLAGTILRDFESARALEYLGKSEQLAMKVLATISVGNEEYDWFIEYRILCFHALVEANLLAGNVNLAEQSLHSMISQINSSLAPANPGQQDANAFAMTPHLSTVLLDSALIHHARGEVQEASRCYFGAAAVAGDVGRAFVGEALEGVMHETRVLASFCNVLILLGSASNAKDGDGKMDQDIAEKLLDELVKEIEEQNDLHQRQHRQSNSLSTGTNHVSTSMVDCEHVTGIMKLCMAMRANSQNEIKKTKIYLLEALRTTETILSVHLKIATLTLLSNVFLDTDAVQTEKMIQTAYKLAKKSGKGVKNMARVCTSVIEELTRRKDERSGDGRSQESVTEGSKKLMTK
ncbi:hypothetical protein HK100_012078 [Physocladia obscura]|uniref:Uncharacterized protein n=1 Tax=Physocladia obscura TaxID=109957 RepID=A0AAD5T098_9FUNG|nr:hypothetical protein HK100_012078 [Physocladia obscura]